VGWKFLIKNSLITLSCLFIIFVINVYPQNIPENINNHIYDFLDKMDAKHFIKIDDETKPYSINYIKSLLLELKSKYELLNKIEKEQLIFYLSRYFKDTNYYLFGYNYFNEQFQLQIEPVVNYSRRWSNGKSSFGRAGGVKLLTSLNDNFGLYTHLQDRGDFYDFSSYDRNISSLRGYEFQLQQNGFEYSDIITGISYGNNKINFLFAKDYNKWGSGKFGQLILSDKVNAFPFIKFEYKPVSWFRFRYIFGSLNSKVIDSNYYYNSYPGSKINEKRYDFINKYIVANLLTFSPFRYIDLSAGNSHIFSGNLRMEMLLPMAFFKYLDRDVGKGVISDGNGQLFFDISIRYPKKFKFYGTWFIDVISIRKSLHGNYIENWFGYTAGLSTYDIFLNNFEWGLEYTKISPWVYEHKNLTTTYKHLGYTLGHWIGQNADLFDIYLKYYLKYNLRFDLILEYLRKGAEVDVYYAYEGRDELKVYFLYPPVRKDFRIKLNLEYEPIYSLILKFNYEYQNIKDSDISRTPLKELGAKHIFTIGIDYGFPY